MFHSEGNHKMWNDTTREKYERSGLRYAGDLTDAEWGGAGTNRLNWRDSKFEESRPLSIVAGSR